MTQEERQLKIHRALQQAGLLIERGEKARAAELLRHVAQAAPDQAAAWVLLARATDNRDESRDALRKAIGLKQIQEAARLRALADQLETPLSRQPARKPVRRKVAVAVQLVAAVALVMLLVAIIWVAVGVPLGVTEPQLRDLNPSWPPQNNRIAFTSSRTDKDSVWVVDIDGSNLFELLPQMSGESREPGWSPDGSHIVYRFQDDYQSSVWVVGIPKFEGGPADAPMRVWCCQSDTRRNTMFPVWSPDGKTIAFTSLSAQVGQNGKPLNDIYLIDAPTGADYEPSQAHFRNLSNTSISDEEQLSWSPDSQSLTYDAGVPTGMPAGQIQNDAYEIDIQTGISRPLFLNVTHTGAYAPVWSPDRQWVAYQTAEDGNADIKLVDAGRTKMINVTGSSYWEEDRPSWSADSKQLLYGSSSDNRGDIWMMGVDGSNPVNLTRQIVTVFVPRNPWLPVLVLLSLIPLVILVSASFDWAQRRQAKVKQKPIA